MYRTALRTASRPALRSMRLQGQTATKRFASTSTPVNRPRSWKSSALRWGLAGGALYYYSTSSLFADEAASQPKTIPEPPQFAASDLPTVDSVLEEKRKQIQAKIEKEAPPAPTSGQEPGSPDAAAAVGAEGEAPEGEEGAGQQAAFNPETGEINWDCPCLGGMAHGPCGEEFKTAFSCFVFSETDPKGMDCIDKFQGMQTCFKQYPEIYGAELTDDGDDDLAADAPLDTEGAPIAQAEAKESPAELPAELPAAPSTPAAPKEDVKVETKKEEPKEEPKKEETTTPAPPRAVEPPAPAWEDARAANNETDKQ